MEVWPEALKELGTLVATRQAEVPRDDRAGPRGRARGLPRPAEGPQLRQAAGQADLKSADRTERRCSRPTRSSTSRRRWSTTTCSTATAPLRDALAFNAPRLDTAPLRALGAALGSAAMQQHARLANIHPPQLHTHDRFGHRIDEVEFHPSYHALLGAALGAGLHGAPWAAGAAGAPASAPPASCCSPSSSRRCCARSR